MPKRKPCNSSSRPAKRRRAFSWPPIGRKEAGGEEEESPRLPHPSPRPSPVPPLPPLPILSPDDHIFSLRLVESSPSSDEESISLRLSPSPPCFKQDHEEQGPSTSFTFYPPPRKASPRHTSRPSQQPSTSRLVPYSPSPTPPPQEYDDQQPSTSAFNPYEYLDVIKCKTKRFQKGPLVETEYKFNVRREFETEDLMTRLLQFQEILEAAFAQILQDAPSTSRAQLYIVNDKCQKSCISTCRRTASELTFEHISDRLTKILDSDDTVNLSDTRLHLSTYAPDPTVGGGHGTSVRTRYEHSRAVWSDGKKSLYDPMKKTRRVPPWLQQHCVALAIARQLFMLENPQLTYTSNQANNYPKSVACREKAIEIVKMAGLDPSKAPYSLSQLPELKKSLPDDVALNVYDDCAAPFLQLGPRGPRAINLFLWYNEKKENGEAQSDFHAQGINSMSGFFGLSLFCHYCYKGYRRGTHKCSEARCRLCRYVDCTNLENRRKDMLKISCEACTMFFYTDDCLKAHEKECGKMVKCKMCTSLFVKAKLKSHTCGRPYCARCKSNHSPFDGCFVQGRRFKKSNKDKKNLVIWYADTETQVDPKTQDHRANLLILQRHDNKETREFKGPNAMRDFVKACMPENTPFKDSVIVFHNAAGFDAHLWYKALIDLGTPPKNLIRKQQRIIGMETAQNNILCRDSLQFIPGTPLSAFPKTFGLDCGSKGDFPHGISTPKWVQFGDKIIYKETVDGVEHRFPLLKYFWPEKKRAGDLLKLEAWHKEEAAKYMDDPFLEYCPEEELIKYCRHDVQILREGFEKYRSEWLEQYPALEPLDSLTFPSYNNKIFREVYMPKNSLSLLPPQGYEFKNRPTSVPALTWIAWKEQQLGLGQLRTGRKGHEVKIGSHWLDGTGVAPGGVPGIN